MPFHSLLERQLRRAFGASAFGGDITDPALQSFVVAVDAAYRQSDDDRAMIERSLELSSRELLDRNAELRAVFHALPDLVFLVDREGSIVDCRGGRDADVVDPRKCLAGRRICGLACPDARQQFAAAAARTAPGGAVESFEYALDTPGGRRHYEARMAGLPDARAVAVVRDITERKLAEASLVEGRERFEMVARATTDVVWDYDVAAGRAWWGEGLTTVLGWPRTSLEMPYSFWTERVHAGDIEAASSSFESFLAGKDAHWSAEYRFLRGDGTYADIVARAYAARDSAGRAVRAVGTMLDISARKRAEAERASLGAQLRQAQRMEVIGQLAGGVAHDFNNLLTAILGFGEMVRNALGPGHAQARSMDQVIRAGERAARLTQQLLAFSRRQVLESQILDPSAVVAGIEPMLRRLIGEDVDLATVTPAGLGAIRADRGQLEQVIMNLAVNARDAMPSGGKLTVEVQAVELDQRYADRHPEVRPGHHVMLSVADTGVGMDAHTREHLFEPFFTTKEFGHGTGLGLATVYGIVRQSDGHIAVYSEPGLGTTFKTYFPRVDARSSDSTGTGASAIPGGDETILVVEDEESVRAFVAGTLEERGYRVLLASCGPEAVAVAGSHPGPIHLVVTDVVMPGMNGRELAERIEADRPGTSVLYVSGYTDDAVVRHGILHMEVPFLQKPFTPAALATKVRNLLGAERADGVLKRPRHSMLGPEFDSTSSIQPEVKVSPESK